MSAWKTARADVALDQQLVKIGPVYHESGDEIVIADGMWRNPNHFFRLRLFVEALNLRQEKFRLLGVLRRKSDHRARSALERIGFKDFLYIEEDEEFRTEAFLAESENLLASIKSHADLLCLDLPEDVPAYTFYDTVLKLALSPQPPLNHPLWKTVLAETLRNCAIYARELSNHRVKHIALSHPWKNEWATLTWLGLKRDIPVYHLTGFCEAIRIRRLRTCADYATPVEHLPRRMFDSLRPHAQRAIIQIGSDELIRRATGQSSDINTRRAFDPGRRIHDRTEARRALSGQIELPVAVIYSHVWFDFPHTFAMRNFSDFRDWMELTIREIRRVDNVIWLLKPHPTESWYGGFSLAEMAGDLPSHVRLLPHGMDSQTVLHAADAIVTVHGTIAMEAAAAGVPVIAADRSYYSDWDIGHMARDRSEYVRLLEQAGVLGRVDLATRDRAKACFALSLAEPPPELGALSMTCDSGGLALYGEIAKRYQQGARERRREAERIAAFLAQSKIDAFAVFHLSTMCDERG